MVALIVKHYHEKTLHGGVSSTMSSIREKFWIPKLRVIVKKIVHQCNLCKRHRIKPLPNADASKLPSFRTSNTDPFVVTGMDFAGPMIYKTAKKILEKVLRCFVYLCINKSCSFKIVLRFNCWRVQEMS